MRLTSAFWRDSRSLVLFKHQTPRVAGQLAQGNGPRALQELRGWSQPASVQSLIRRPLWAVVCR